MTAHHLHSVIVSYNRSELTEQAIRSYVETVSLPYSLIVMDNGSDDKTVERLSRLISSYVMTSDGPVSMCLLEENRYPGFATNRGWEEMPPETTLLHRGDNDFAYLPGWCDEVVKRFKKPSIGQVGLRTDREELKARWNVGGNNVIRRKLWDEGLRYDERPWGEEYPPGYTEDSLFSPAVKALGYEWVRVKEPCIVSLSREDPDDEYYRRSWEIRGITPPPKETA